MTSAPAPAPASLRYILIKMGGSAMQPDEFSVVLQQCRNGDKQALDALTPVVYAELRKLAAWFMRNEQPGQTLQPTALIHEAYLRLAHGNLPDFQSRTHFFGIAAHIM